MKKRELHNLCIANSIPPLLYEWSFGELENSYLNKKLSPIFDDIDSFISGRKVWYIYMESDSILASRLGVTFLKAAYISGFIGSRYIDPIRLANYQHEDWYEDGDVYSDLLNTDFLVIDKVTSNLEQFQLKIWDKFVENRLLLKKSTVFVGMEIYKKVFNKRAADILKTLNAQVLTEKGISIC